MVRVFTLLLLKMKKVKQESYSKRLSPSKFNKSGQVYIIAAIIVIGLILGYVTVTNVLRKSDTNVRVYDMRDELNIESGEVLDYGTYSGDSISKTNPDGSVTTFTDLNALLSDFTDVYNEHAGEGSDLIFVFGNGEVIKAISYKQYISGTISVSAGTGLGSSITFLDEERSEGTVNVDSNEIEVKITGSDGNEKDYTFPLKEGENFYFVILEKSGGEEFVAQG